MCRLKQTFRQKKKQKTSKQKQQMFDWNGSEWTSKQKQQKFDWNGSAWAASGNVKTRAVASVGDSLNSVDLCVDGRRAVQASAPPISRIFPPASSAASKT